MTRQVSSQSTPSLLPRLMAAPLLCLVLVAQGHAQPSQGQPRAEAFHQPGYQVLRSSEDWSVLAHHDRHQTGDLFDPIKYVPLTQDGEVWASFGGQLRVRIEGWNNFSFGAPVSVGHDDAFLLTRARLHGDLHLGEQVRIFVEGKSALSTDRDLVGGQRTMDVDTIELQNAFVDLTLPIADEGRLTLRSGRQELSFGRQRLVSPLDWANVRRTFDGFSGILRVNDWSVTAFWTQPVEVRKYDFNPSEGQTAFYGVYAAGRLPTTTVGLDLYWLMLDRDATVSYAGVSGEEDRHTLGGRLHGKYGATGFDYDLEGAYQFGEVGGTDISAFMVAAELGYRPYETSWSPRFFVGFDYASGGASGSHANTFNQLFPLGHAYLGYIDVIGRQNVMAVHAGVSAQPIDRLTIELQGHAFWRADRDDAVYNAGGGVLRAEGLSGKREIGAEIDLLVRLQLDRHTELMAGYSRFFAGDFIEDTGPSEDIDFVYTALQITF